MQYPTPRVIQTVLAIRTMLQVHLSTPQRVQITVIDIWVHVGYLS